MRPQTPTSFAVAISDANGSYELKFTPDDDEGHIDTLISGIQMRWHVEYVDIDAEGNLTLGGLTTGSEKIWNDAFWFELVVGNSPTTIDYHENHNPAGRRPKA